MIFISAIFIAFILKGLHTIDTSENPDIVTLAKGITILNIVFAIISITGTHIHYFPGDIYFWFWNGVLVHLSVLSKPDTGENKAITDETYQGTIVT